MAERTVKSRYEQVVTELPRILPLCYLVMVCIGMLFNYFKFKHFGINIFQYASVFDFLISPFEDPTIIWFMILSPIIPIIAFITDRIWIKRFPVSYKKSSFGMSEKSWYKPVMRITYLALVIIYIFLFSFFYGIYTYRAVKMQDDITVRYNDNEDIPASRSESRKYLILINRLGCADYSNGLLRQKYYYPTEGVRNNISEYMKP